MNEPIVEVWECEHAAEVNASPEVLWSLFRDIPGWPKWNAGIEHIEIDGPFAVGTQFVMTPPGQEPVVSRLREVRENVSFLDETCVGDLKIFVDHRIESIGARRSRVVFSLEAFGPACEEIGAAVSADFPDVLKALAHHAEVLVCRGTV